MPAQIFKAGEEREVDSVAGKLREAPVLTALADGGWIAVWGSYDAFDQIDVVMQRYDRNGNEIYAVPQVVNKETNRDQYEPSVTALADGGWVVTWTSQDQDSSGGGVYQQRYSSSGVKLYADDFLVNTYTTNFQETATVTGLADGGWVVTWRSRVQDGSEGSVYQQRFNAAGAAQGAEERINQTIAGSQLEPRVTSLSDGGWLVTWTSPDSATTRGIFQQRYSKDGTRLYSEDRKVNVVTDNDQWDPVVTSLKDGGWVIVWVSQDGSGTGIYQQRFDRNGNATSPADMLVNITTTDGQDSPSVASLADGGWIVTWTSADQDGTGVYQQRFDQSGRALSPADMLVNVTTHSSQSSPSVIGLADGNWVVAWESYEQDGSIAGIYQRHFEANAAPSAINLSGGSVRELATNGTAIGTLTATDQNVGDTHRFDLIDSAGGRFALVGNQIVVANGYKLDFEQAQSHQVTVRVTDSMGLTFDKVLSIGVLDWATENTTGSADNDMFLGGNGADILSGGIGVDRIDGSGGRDRLNGGLGNDTLTGGADRDIFIFDSMLGTDRTDRQVNFDTITDFKPKQDKIYLENAIFRKLRKTGSLNEDFFQIGSKADDPNDYILYNKRTGVLSYDRDGSGGAKAIEFAILKKNLKLTYKDFFVM